MAGLLSGLEKFGLHYLEAAGLYEEEKKEKEAEKPKAAPVAMKEEDYLYDKTHECPVCYATIKERNEMYEKDRVFACNGNGTLHAGRLRKDKLH